MQQTTFFVNTVISKQAIMKFHGVGNPNRTPVEASALELGRDALAEAVSFFARIPPMTKRYKRDCQRYRLLAEALSHLFHTSFTASTRSQ